MLADEIKKLEQLARDQAKRSKCIERQVGCIIYNVTTDSIIGMGYNYSTTCVCNDSSFYQPECAKDVVHAEDAALRDIDTTLITRNDHCTLFVTHPPCNNCLNLIQDFRKEYDVRMNIHVCEQFIKFDDDKLRYDLIPPRWLHALAKILTYGAKKYKPNNWQQGEIDRYVAATMRHFEAYRDGEECDQESGMPHLWHVMTNIGFLITLEEKKENE